MGGRGGSGRGGGAGGGEGATVRERGRGGGGGGGGRDRIKAIVVSDMTRSLVDVEVVQEDGGRRGLERIILLVIE